MLTSKDLFDAISELDLAQLTALIKQGLDVNASDENGFTPLMRLIPDYSADEKNHDRLEAVRILLAAGADPQTANRYGWTALSIAVEQGMLEFVGLLTEQGLRITDAVSLNSFLGQFWPRHPFLAQRVNYTGILERILLERPDLEVRNERGLPALVIACKEGNTVAIDKLLLAGANPNRTSESGTSPLEALCNFAWRARSECLSSIRQLLEAGALPNNPENVMLDNDHKVALMWTVYSGGNSEAVVRLLLEAGANPHASDHTNITALEYAERSKRPDLVNAIKQYL